MHLTELRLEGLRAKQQCLERALGAAHDCAAELPNAVEGSDREPEAALVRLVSQDADDPVLTACADLAMGVRELGEACGSEARTRAGAVAARIADELRGRGERLRAELQAIAAEMRTARQAIEQPAALHGRRAQAEALLASLEKLQPDVTASLEEEEDLQHELRKLKRRSSFGDPAVERAQDKLSGASDYASRLFRRRDGIVAEIAALSTAHVPSLGDVVGDDASVLLDFPELPIRAVRIVHPFQAYEVLDAAARARFDVELLLRRASLLACDRSYDSYSDLVVIAASKPNVKRATLRGVAQGADKILKEYGVGEFKRIKRAVATASHLRHPGIVPVDGAFLQRGDVVVVQSPFYAGGNMRQWCRGKSAEARLRAAQRVAEAVRFLHAHGVLHRDLKPENVVFDSTEPTATPALCDFDLSVNTHETMASTLMRGTLLYLAPDLAPSPASDVFALGVALLDVLFCDGDEERLHQLVLGSARRAGVTLADLERVRGELARRPDDTALAALVSSMIAPQPAERPDAAAVAESLSELLDVRTCCVCHCPEPRSQGVECDAAERHFTCDDCLSAHVTRLEALSDADSGGVKCCASDWGCASRFPIQVVAQHATPLAFATLQRHANDLKHVALQGEFEQWKERFEAELAARSEQERRALAARRHIEEMMDLRCPRCGSVFDQFVGCAALTCAAANCGAGFCAFCLTDCGSDAHAHVRECRLNPKRNEYFVSEAEWARVVDGQRREKLQAYWATLEPEVRDALAADASITQIFRDLQLAAMLGSEAFAEQAAQLRGMGFADERAVRWALAEVGGDVEAAVELLWTG